MKRFEGMISEDFELVSKAIPAYFELQRTLSRMIAVRYKRPVIIDLGVGTGITTAAILASNPGSYVIGIDDERAMLSQAKTNLLGHIENGEVELQETDALQFLIEAKAESADVVASSYTIHNCLKKYRLELERQILRVLKPGGMFINNDKYAVEDRGEYAKEITDQIMRFDVLREIGRADLRRMWIEHEIADQIPERIMWTREATASLESIGFVNVAITERVGQYAILTAHRRSIASL